MHKFCAKLITALILTSFLATVTAQEQPENSSYLEINADIGLLSLIQNNVTHRFDSYTEDMSGSMQKTGFSGFAFHFGLLGNRKFGTSFSLQSGLKILYLNGRYEGNDELRFVNPIQDKVEEVNWDNKAVFTGFEIPVLVEYRRPVKDWSLYTQLGLSLAHSKVKRDQEGVEYRYYNYNLDYFESCDCYQPTNIQKLTPAFQQDHKDIETDPQFELNGLFGLGAIIKGKENKEFRVGYRFTANLLPLRKGNNSYDRVYESSRINSVDHYQLIHQLEFGMNMADPIPEAEQREKIWNRFYAGFGISMQQAFKNNRDAIRSGFGWGRYGQLMYLSRMGLGVRAEIGKWIAPNSRYGTTSLIYKGEAIYHLPFGYMIYAGASKRNDNNSDGGYGNGYGYHLGNGLLVPLHGVVKIQFLYTTYYYPNFPDERFLMEFGVGTLLSF